MIPSPPRCTEDGKVIELYGVSVSPDLVSRMTDSVHGANREWQSRPLTASEALEKKGIAEMKKIVPEALLVVLLLAAWGVFELTTGYGAETRRVDALISAIVAGAAAGMVFRWAGILAAERSAHSPSKTARWKALAVAALISGCTTGGLMYLLYLFLEISFHQAFVFSLFGGLLLGWGTIAARGVRIGQRG